MTIVLLIIAIGGLAAVLLFEAVSAGIAVLLSAASGVFQTDQRPFVRRRQPGPSPA